MLIRPTAHAPRAASLARALRSLLCGAISALVAYASIAGSPAAAAPTEARPHKHEASVPSPDDIAETVRRAIEHANQAVAAAVADVPRMIAQIDFDDVIADTSALAFIGNDLAGAREIVKNAPYSAEAVTESVQVLSDGNRIVRKSTTMLARDRFGRTRQERRNERGTIIYISDPIDEQSYALNPDTRTAVRIPRMPRVPVPAFGHEPPRPLVAPAPPILPPDIQTPRTGPTVPPGSTGASRTGTELDARPGRVLVRKAGDGTEGEDVRVEVIRVGGDGGARPSVPPQLAGLPTMPRGKGETKDLGARDFDGVRAEGRLTTQTIPAGAIGNEKPITIATERWFSPELNVVVYAKTSDPRAGETVYRLVNLKRADPPPELFRLPDDYRVRGERKAR